METILNYTNEIVNEIYKHDEHWDYSVLVEPNEIQLVTKDWTPYILLCSQTTYS